MSALTVTDVDSVRSEGSLKSPSEAAGAASDKQVQSAIRNAQRKMRDKLTDVVYFAVQAYSDTDLADQTKNDQYDAFLHAESCFAIAWLCEKLNAQQLSDTGVIQSVEIGKSRQNFASSEESKKTRGVWEQQGNRWLAPYLAVPLDTVTQQPTAFASKNGSFYVGAL